MPKIWWGIFGRCLTKNMRRKIVVSRRLLVESVSDRCSFFSHSFLIFDNIFPHWFFSSFFLIWNHIFWIVVLHLFSILFTVVFLNCFHIVYHINCHWFSSNCFLTGFNHLLCFLITRSMKILIRAPGQVLVKPKILVNRWSPYPPTIWKVCLFLEISTTLMNLILKLYSKAVADWRLLQVIQRNLMNLKKSLWGSLAPTQVLFPPFTHVRNPPLSHHRTFCRSLNGRRCQFQHCGLDIFNPPSSRFLKPLSISPYISLNCLCFFPSHPCVECYSVLF